MTVNTLRAAAIADAMCDIREIDATGIDRSSIELIGKRLLELAKNRDLFPWSDFPSLASKDGSTLYLLSQDEDHRFALYIQSVADATEAPPHDHLTWACIAGIEGEEINRRYDLEGAGDPKISEEVCVEEGVAIGFLPDDVHSIHVQGGALNFHCYGNDLLKLPARNYWNAELGVWLKKKVRFPIIDARV